VQGAADSRFSNVAAYSRVCSLAGRFARWRAFGVHRRATGRRSLDGLSDRAG